MFAKRSAMRSLTVLAAALGVGLGAVPALAQQVLVCFTLHNDLANFDRRANKPNYMFGQKEIALALKQYQWLCPNGRARDPRIDCTGLVDDPQDFATAEFYRVIREWVVSPLGGSDPIRLRIMDEMYRNSCPLPPEALYLLSLRQQQAGARQHRGPRPVLRVLGSAEKRKAPRPEADEASDDVSSSGKLFERDAR